MKRREPDTVCRGRLGESIAAHYLEMNGYRILGRNLRCGPLEIDLLAERAGIIAVVEVRLRSSGTHGRPEESVRRIKRERLSLAAGLLMERLAPPAGTFLRFDVIAIERQAFGLLLRHLQNLWRLPSR
ncbi:MAG: YraN family protein [Candidatus Eisenbacteria bacterium]